MKQWKYDQMLVKAQTAKKRANGIIKSENQLMRELFVIAFELIIRLLREKMFWEGN